MRRAIFQFFLLMWKNLTVHRRNLSATAHECFLPTLFSFVLLLLKLLSDNKSIDRHIYQQRDIGLPIFPVEIGYVPECPVVKSVTDLTILRHLNYLRTYKENITEILDKHSKFKRTHARKLPQTNKPPVSKGFPDIEAARRYFLHHSMDMNYVLEFKDVPVNATQMPKNVSIIIHPFRKEGQVWNTDTAYDTIFKRSPRNDVGDQSFAYVETMVSKSVLATWLADQGKDPMAADFPLQQKRIPVDPFREDAMFQTLRLQLTLFMVLNFMMSVFIIVKNVLYEKENKIKESMRLMGMNLAVFWLSWFATCFIFIMPAVGILTFILHYDFKGDGALLGYSDPTVTLVLLVCYSLCVISYAMVITCIANKGNEGAIIGGVFFLAEYVPYEIVVGRFWEVPRFTKLAFSLSFNVAIGMSNHLTIRREVRMEGVHWSNIDEFISVSRDNYTHMDSIRMLCVDMSIHFLLIWYLDNVFPGEYGVPKPYLFFLTRSYWCGTVRALPASDHATSLSHQHNTVFFEKEPVNLHPGVVIKGLRKVFGTKISVSNLTLNMYQGQITVLLGHNGAGKTTTMSMLTGFIPPTKGTAMVNGYDICTNIDGVRKSLGLCPQHDVLFDVLTVREHLWFYAKLKGEVTENLAEEIRTMVEDIGLEGKARTRVSRISGGQKRSLSVGIALMGDSKVVFLDEPSSGMDPATRRLTWDLLQKNRKGRTMLLSTHYMDEADTLANRIAILVEGKLQCCGTPLFLKKLYGAGYHLVIEKDPKCNLKHLLAAIQAQIPGALIESAQMFEASFLLPDTETHKFPGLFRYLNKHKQKLGITGFGTSATTMEEVFLKSEVINDERKLSQSSEQRSSTTMMHEEDIDIDNFDNLNRDIKPITGYSLKYAQFCAQFRKRYLVAVRHWPVTFLLYLVPACVLFLYFTIENNMEPLYDQTMRGAWLNLSLFWEGRPVSVYLAPTDLDGSGRSAMHEKTVAEYIEAVTEKYGVIVNVTQAQVESLDDFFLEEQRPMGRAVYDHTHQTGAIFHNNGTRVAVYNGQPYHTLFVSINLIMNAVIKSLLDPTYELVLGLKPLPREGEVELQFQVYHSHRTSFLIGMFMGMGYSMYAASVVHYLLWERQSGVKHMHAISGVSMTMYWAPTFAWDVTSFLMPTVFVFAITYLNGCYEYLEDNNWLLGVLAIVLFVWACLPCVYAMHFLFDTAASGSAGIIVWNLFSVLLANIVVFQLTMPESETKHIGYLVKYVAIALSPGYNLSECFRTINLNFLIGNLCKARQQGCEEGFNSLCCNKHPSLCYSDITTEGCYSWSEHYITLDVEMGIGWSLLALSIQGVVGWAGVAAIEYGFFQKLSVLRAARSQSANVVGVSSQQATRSSYTPEDDVTAEKMRVNAMTAEIQKDSQERDPLLLVNLKRSYGHLKAVDGLSVGVTQSECFGLLGPSGSGKSTVFRMLTGQTRVNHGNAFFNEFNVRTDLRATQHQIGYCPQSDAHIGELTASETLHLYGRLRGIPNKDLETLIKVLVNIALLGQHAHRRCGTYSGGNRRKLSLAMALVGNPAFLLLDEPSCGMDPKARRQMWDILCKIRASGRTLIVSSHSMEECDALCTKLGILLRGRLMCLGSPQHLKNKYGQGYTLVVKMGALHDGNIARTDAITEFVQKEFSDTTVFDDHQGYVHLQIKDPQADLAGVFSLMERCRREMDVEDYAVNETSLEQVFLMFTMIQRQDEEQRAQSCWFLQAGFFGDNFCP